MIEPDWPDLRCTRCGGPLELEYVYTGGPYSEHREVDSIDCECGASWNAAGKAQPTSWLRDVPVPNPDECINVLMPTEGSVTIRTGAEWVNFVVSEYEKREPPSEVR